jgi:hypothetical protein
MRPFERSLTLSPAELCQAPVAERPVALPPDIRERAVLAQPFQLDQLVKERISAACDDMFARREGTKPETVWVRRALEENRPASAAATPPERALKQSLRPRAWHE